MHEEKYSLHVSEDWLASEALVAACRVVALAALVAAFGLVAFGAERLAVLVSGDAVDLVVGLADLRATVSSYPFCPAGSSVDQPDGPGETQGLG